MASNKNEALYKGKRHYDAKGNPLGGIKVEVDGEYMVEIEGGEYKICTDAYHSDKKLEFKNKTNKEVLDYIHNDFSCTFKQGEADSGDFILCRLVVLDPKKHDRKGTVRQILDDMQSEKSCRVSIGKNKMKKGGRIEATPEELEKRWHKKKEHISKMADTIKRLRLNITKDIKGDDERIRLTALAIAVMDKTAERVGNSDSEQNGHFGITGFKKSHVSIDGNTVRLNYVGKSGVEHEKQFSDELIASELKKAIKYSDCEFVFCTNDGFRVKSDKINRYLSEFGVTAKDIRGYSANRWIIDKLNKIEPNDIGETEAKRKRKFNKVLKFVAGKVGHGASTLRNHYMTPELEEEFVRHGKIIDLSEFYKSGGTVKLSKTPAPLNDRVYGSKKNKPESASSVKSAKEIELSNVVVKLIEKKIHEHNTKHPDKKVNLSAAKAVVRRGMGAYSVTHRPTISGGKPNSRMAWGLARLNAFLYKAVNGHSKSEHYTQDDDLLNDLHIKHQNYEDGGSFSTERINMEDAVDKAYKEAIELFEANEYDIHLGSNSKTSWGHSRYFYVNYKGKSGENFGNGIKIRVSDHSVENFIRMQTEILVNAYSPNLNEALSDVDFILKRENFEIIEEPFEYYQELTVGGKEYKPETDEVIEDVTRPNKQNKVYRVKRKMYGKHKYKIDKRTGEKIFMWESGGSMDKNCIDFIKNTEAILTNGYYHNFGSYCLITYNSGNQKDLNVYQTVNLLLSKSLSELLKIDHESARNLISNYYDNARRFDTLDIIKELKGCNIVIADRHDVVCTNSDIRYEAGGNIDREKHNTVGCIIYNPAHGYLILQRGILGEDTDLLWHVLSGGVDEGETLEQTVAREIGEEIGYEGAMDIEYLDSIEFDDYNFHYFYVGINSPITIKLNDENEQYAWTDSISEILTYNLIPQLEDYLIGINEGIESYEHGGLITNEQKELHKKWKSLINMSYSELEKFYNSEEGKKAGLTKDKAHSLGIHYGRESARWILKMKKTNVRDWTDTMWEWAKRQVNFVTRMSGNAGDLIDDKGSKTRKYLSLLIWGNDPKKKQDGGILSATNKPFEIDSICAQMNALPFLSVKKISPDEFEFFEQDSMFEPIRLKANEFLEVALTYGFK